MAGARTGQRRCSDTGKLLGNFIEGLERHRIWPPISDRSHATLHLAYAEGVTCDAFTGTLFFSAPVTFPKM
jgi:hypothetical protein